MRIVGLLAATIIFTAVSFADDGSIPSELLRQVQAVDALGGWLDLQTQQATDQSRVLRDYLQDVHQLDAFGKLPATRPTQRLAYDRALAGALLYIHRDNPAPADPAISELNEFQLRHELAILNTQNLELYLRLNQEDDQTQAMRRYLQFTGRYPDFLAWSRDQQPTTQPTPQPTTQPTARTPEDVADQLQQLAQSTAKSSPRPPRQRPRQSFLNPQPPNPLPNNVMNHLKAAADLADQLEQPDVTQSKTADIVASLLAGQPMPGTFAVPSTIAPVNARMPGSLATNATSPRTFALQSSVRNNLPLPATPPGTPAAVIPNPEVTLMLAAMLGISPTQAADIATGRSTLAEVTRAQSASQTTLGADPASMGSTSLNLSPNDPRWGPFFYKPGEAMNDWHQDYSQQFIFAPGGGVYNRADRRVNDVPDLRVNIDPDRRVNANNDRRTNIQVDPRINP